MTKAEAIMKMNEFGQQNCPFLFIIDFELKNCIVKPLVEIDSEEIKFSIGEDFRTEKTLNREVEIKASPMAFESYKKSFDLVWNHLKKGNSFLTNLTAETPIELNNDLAEIYALASAKYKLYLKDKLVCFSPETFVKVNDLGKISSFPMKGTLDAEIENAEEILLNDPKEKFEHTTIVDLIRNDLSQICTKVWVEKFRFIDKIKTADQRMLLQVSSEVCGQLPENWKKELGNWFFTLLPAGSISGAPKPKTLEIIKQAEKQNYATGKRGYYSGVFGVFDGETLDSAVMIRFIEKKSNGYVFKSGGGITARSEAKNEYKELIQKIYVPVF